MTFILIFITVVTSISCFSNPRLAAALALNPYRIVHHREWYRIFTHLFVHGDYTHLLVNMFVLFSFGQYMEQLFKMYAQAGTLFNSHLSYLLLYFGGAVASSLYDVIKQRNNPNYNSIGASGSVSAVVFASIFFNPWNKIYFLAIVPIPGILFGVFYLLYSRYAARNAGDHINHRAHIYGALYGFCFPVLLNPTLLSLFWDNLTRF